MIRVLYHASCLDGFGAAFAAWSKLKDTATYHPVRYHESFPWDVIDIEDTIYIVDFSYPNSILTDLRRLHTVVVIDHHKSAQEDLKNFPGAIFDLSKSGAILTWNYFFPLRPPPQLLRYIQDRDLWTWELEDTEAVCESLWSKRFDFEDWESYSWNPTELRNLIVHGSLLLESKYKAVSQMASQAFMGDGEWSEAVFCNTPVYPSETCHKLLQDYPQASFAVGFQYTKDQKWRLHFRSRKGGYDVSQVAKELGGGGHQAAAGTTVDEVSFL